MRVNAASVIASAAKQSRARRTETLDGFVAAFLAMTNKPGAHIGRSEGRAGEVRSILVKAEALGVHYVFTYNFINLEFNSHANKMFFFHRRDFVFIYTQKIVYCAKIIYFILEKIPNPSNFKLNDVPVLRTLHPFKFIICFV